MTLGTINGVLGVNKVSSNRAAQSSKRSYLSNTQCALAGSHLHGERGVVNELRKLTGKTRINGLDGVHEY